MHHTLEILLPRGLMLELPDGSRLVTTGDENVIMTGEQLDELKQTLEEFVFLSL